MRTKWWPDIWDYFCLSLYWFEGKSKWFADRLRDLITTTSPFSQPFLNVSDLPIKTHRVSDKTFSPLLYQFSVYVKGLFTHSTPPRIEMRSFGCITYFRLWIDERYVYLVFLHLFEQYMTDSQLNLHFFLQWNVRLHTGHTLVRCFKMHLLQN